MFLYSLDSSYFLFDLIEGYESLIWTERYAVYGDFELTTYLISETMAALPLGKLISLQDTPEVMMVETHSISTDENGQSILKVTGRSVDSFMLNRASIQNDVPLGTTGTPPLYTLTGNSWTCAATLIRNSMVTGTVDTKDIIPNFEVVATVLITGTSRYHEIERGNLYDAVQKLLAEDRLGLSNMRPNSIPGSSATLLRMSIYQGLDRTDLLTLYEANGDFTTSSYLASIADYTTVVYCAGPTQISNPVKLGTTSYSGFNRRAALLDASDITTTVAADQIAALTARGTAYLGQHDSVKMFECTVSPTANATYRTNYYLGDIIKCITNYGLNQAMVVNEVVRVEDANGEVIYPSLTVI